ncbi:MAG: hypothetical protein NVSMB25_07230 [Thermoleophilaceae bacterium]
MRRRSAIWISLFAAVLLVLAAAAYGVDSSRRETVAKGVRVAGIDVGGMSAARARSVVRAHLRTLLGAPVVATYASRSFSLSPQAAGVRADVSGMVDAAIARGRGGWFVGRTLDVLTGRSLDQSIPAKLTFSHRAVSAFVSRIAAAVDRSPRDATVEFTSAGPHQLREQTGVAVQREPLRASVESVLVTPGSRSVTVPTQSRAPKVRMSQLSSRYVAAIVVDRASFTLKLYRHLRYVRSYPIAVGRQGLETPAGLYHVQEKQVDPPWQVPNSSWAGALAGRTIPPGPQDPLKARWIGFDGSAGIHGTDDVGSLGSSASHGCIRMAVPDVIALYPDVRVGDPVYIA